MKKKPTYKVYIMVHDSTDVLIGQGGASGKYLNLRQGYHLPGGTYDPSKETPQEAAVRELKEETGISLGVSKVSEPFTSTADGLEGVTFVVAKVASVSDLVSSFTRPTVTNFYDEPFTSLLALSKDNCWDNPSFASKYWTDWFRDGLWLANDKGLLK
jgi:8-oxo-dGTP pyrophosphatase MutT (NUDIX family)